MEKHWGAILSVADVLGEPLLLVHAAMNGDGGEVLLHQQLREGDAPLHRLHEYHNLNTDIFSITKFLFYRFKNLMKHRSVTNDNSETKTSFGLKNTVHITLCRV
jgi:hypothetical protein